MFRHKIYEVKNMSAEQQTALTQEAVADAFGVCMQNVHKRAFLHKLAELRPQYAPQSEVEAEDLTGLGLKLVQAAAEQGEEPATPFAQPKTASDSRFAGATTALDTLLGGEKAAAGADDSEIWQAAYALGDEPETFKAASILTQVKLATLAQQQQQQQDPQSAEAAA
ncbi:MAG: hypothetical protein ACYSWU_15035 [Planctomycetota bacterium]